MDKQLLIKKIFTKEVRDYTSVILFLIVSSFFIIFAIKPALSIAFSLKREAFDLERINAIYERNILKLVYIQSKLENIRNKIYLIDEATPKTPEMRILIDNIKQVASSEGILIDNLSLSSINLKKETKNNQLKPLVINIGTKAGFFAVNNFVKKIINQKRIKVIKNFKILRETDYSTNSAQLKIIMEIDGYYL